METGKRKRKRNEEIESSNAGEQRGQLLIDGEEWTTTNFNTRILIELRTNTPRIQPAVLFISCREFGLLQRGILSQYSDDICNPAALRARLLSDGIIQAIQEESHL
ncbi:unnamed protein product [Cuscuta europaea]|uniref:Uncharacterized protein n=1 Tax=Cuscuta europaea TaxID=41803 RepID=A0A9P0YSE3_CUSEU|nr:unnamed protein product [Cuscuta europaea]